MSFLGRLRTSASAFRFGFSTLLGFDPARARGFDAAKGGRMVADWVAASTSSDTEIRASIRRLIDRSRDLERNNDYQRGYLGDCEDNILGAVRQDLRMDCGEYVYSRDKAPVWKPDHTANRIIEEAWNEWGKKGTCTICKRYSWRKVKRLAVRAVPRDGNFLMRKVYGEAAGNRFGFALQLWEIDHLDLQKFATLTNGGEIRFGIEYDANSVVVAYWLFAKHPGDYVGGYNLGRGHRGSIRFPADEIYHIFDGDRAEQSVGIPWCVSAITRLRQLGAFEEAAVIAARLGASKAAFFKKIPNQNGAVGTWTGAKDSEGRMQMDVAPGTMEELPEGWDVASIDWKYPDTETGDFRKAMLRGAATSLRTSYTTLGNDLESVNFSSARIGLGDERETWKMHQLFFDEDLWEAVFHDWLLAAILNGAVNLPLAKIAKFDRPRFKGRRWPFLDPVKDVQAAKEGIALRLTSRRQIVDEGGGDIEDVFHDNVADEELADELGLSLAQAPAVSAPAAPPEDDPDKPDPEES